MSETTIDTTMSRTQAADIVKSERGAKYWPFAVFVYPLVTYFTLGIGLWIIWGIQEQKVDPRPISWLRSLGFAFLCLLPFGYLLIASSYGRNLFYLNMASKESDSEGWM